MMEKWELGNSMYLQAELNFEKGSEPHYKMGIEQEESYYDRIKRQKYMEKESNQHGEKLNGDASKEVLKKESKLVASLEREIGYRDGQILKMQQRYDETVAHFRQAVNGLTESLNIKHCDLMEREHFHQRTVQMLVEEKAMLNKVHLAEIRKLQSQNMELDSRLRWKSTALGKSDTQKYLECTKLEKEIQALKEKMQSQNAKENDINNLESRVTVLRTELEEKSERVQNLESLNETLALKELKGRQDIQKICNRFNALRTELEEKANYLESLNNVLILKELKSRRELQEARSESITILKDMLSSRTALVIKRLGEIDRKVFQKACLRKFPNGDSGEISAKLCSSWEEHLRDANWQPFKIVDVKGKLEEIIDEDDGKLKELRNDYGEEVYKTVTNALMEMNEHNPSGRYLVSEIWNSKEGRIATMKEIVQYLAKKTIKRKR